MKTLESDSSDLEVRADEVESKLSASEPQQSRLIEFPGVTRNAVPSWRKEISERVREVQERRAREAAAEAALAADNGLNETDAPQLELLPQTDPQPVNPIVQAALKRIERAHLDSPSVFQQTAPMPAVAYATESNVHFDHSGIETVPSQPPPLTASLVVEETPAGERKDLHNRERSHLSVVPATAGFEGQLESPRPKPRRVISDDMNNPALNYLDSIETAVRVDDVTAGAPALPRLAAGVVDLLVLALICSPFVVGVELMRAPWNNLQVIGLALATVLLTGFLYSTISTALTGRTLGMRLMNLRVVDKRTGLIPTGKQAAGRALLYLLSLLGAGIVLLYALIDSDKRAVHDRFTQTAVIVA